MHIIGYITILMLLIGWEIELRLLSIFAPRRAHTRAEEIFLEGARAILRVAERCWGAEFHIPVVDSHSLPAHFALISNHQHAFDILILRAMFPHHRLRFIAKRALRRGFPAVSILMRIQEHAFIGRTAKGARADMQSIQRLAERSTAESRICPVLFPEGTRSRDGSVAPFHHVGIWRVALKPQLPIVGVAINNSISLGKRPYPAARRTPTRISTRIVVRTEPPHNPRLTKTIGEGIRQEIIKALVQ